MNQGHAVKSCVLAAENESESDEWIDVLSQVIPSAITKSDSQRRTSLTNGDGIGTLLTPNLLLNKQTLVTILSFHSRPKHVSALWLRHAQEPRTQHEPRSS